VPAALFVLGFFATPLAIALLSMIDLVVADCRYCPRDRVFVFDRDSVSTFPRCKTIENIFGNTILFEEGTILLINYAPSIRHVVRTMIGWASRFVGDQME